jgi:hypothetical protein
MSKKTYRKKIYRKKTYRNKKNRKKTYKNKKNRKKTYKNKKNRKMIGGNIIDTTIINERNYNISLYTELPENIKNEAKNMCSNMYPGLDNQNTSVIVDDIMSADTNDIYILRNDENEIVSFIIMRNNLCEGGCFNCNKKCSYILLTCVKEKQRGKRIFSYFLKAVEKYLKTQMIDCIRLTALNPGVFNAYNNLGFITEKQDESLCQYKMIKYL